MEERINRLNTTLTAFCKHLQSSCDALKLSIDRRPIPLDSASSTFIQCLNRRVSTATSDLNVLDSMSFGTVSFEELLGHCTELYKKNQTDLFLLKDHLLQSLGSIPSISEIDDNDDDEDEDIKVDDGSESSAAASSIIINSLQDDPLMDESLSLKSLGLSDACLATLASQANSKSDDPHLFPSEHIKDERCSLRSPDRVFPKSLEELNSGEMEGEGKGDFKPADDVRPFLQLSKDDYDGLPSYMTSLASWEDMLAAVEKINTSLKKKERTNGSNYFHQDEIALLGLGPKARTYLLLLMRMNQLVVETINGLICYKVLPRR